jgi:hypothetical protein
MISLHNRDEAAETTSPWTPSTAIESPAAETFRIHSEFDREKAAIPRGFAKIGFLKPTGNGELEARMKPRSAFFSAAKFDGSLSLSIRQGEEPCQKLHEVRALDRKGKVSLSQSKPSIAFTRAASTRPSSDSRTNAASRHK